MVIDFTEISFVGQFLFVYWIEEVNNPWLRSAGSSADLKSYAFHVVHHRGISTKHQKFTFVKQCAKPEHLVGRDKIKHRDLAAIFF